MRVCPRCDHSSSDRHEFCETCGYRIVLFVKRYPKNRQPTFRPTIKPLKPRRKCPFCGANCRGEACPSHLDLIESEAL